ncbi:MAG: HD-GYP domain-containing protein [Methylocystaceae bacterium]
MSKNNLEINMPHLLFNLSTSLDFCNQGITGHHKRVTVLALNLARAAGVDADQLLTVFQSAIIHDIGATNWKEKSNLTEFDINDSQSHCIKGCNLVAGTRTLATVDTIIRCHHDNWKGSNSSGLVQNAIPLASRIIHLVDRLDVLIRPEIHILEQRESILNRLQAGTGTIFDPNLMDLLFEISRPESFWLDLVSPWLNQSLISMPLWRPTSIGMTELSDLANLFAAVIDQKSPFTHRHSHGVSLVATLLAHHAGLNESDATFIEVAALLHDIGKLSVPDGVLEKPGPLTDTELNWIRQHTYYTYQILKPLSPSTLIPEWAAFHHEKLNGRGYPFGYDASRLDMPARIIAIADIFTALREDRPYRAGLDWDKIINILAGQVKQGYLDADLCSLLIDIQKDIDNNWPSS